MNVILIAAFLFSVGSVGGWGLEVIFRRFFSDANPERKWINPGFMTGPYLPLYGFSLTALYFMARINLDMIENTVAREITLFVIMAAFVTLIEYIAGIIFIKRMKIKLWDYENEWGNIQGVICPKFSFFWIILSAIYYFLIHPHITDSVEWLANNLTFSFFVGFYYGVFALDFWYSMKIMKRIRKFAREKQIVVRYEMLKDTIRVHNEEIKQKGRFVFAFRSEQYSFTENLTEYFNKVHSGIEKTYEVLGEAVEKTTDVISGAVNKTTEAISGAVGMITRDDEEEDNKIEKR